MQRLNWLNMLQSLPDNRLVVIPSTRVVALAKLENKFPKNLIYLCDAYLDNAETGQEIVGGYQRGRCINIDHHAPTPQMSRIISSAPLAISHVKARGAAGPHDHVVINHTDCDSVLSAAIMLGLLPPEEEFGKAAVAADHTGQENPIADLLQSLAKLKDFDFSLRNLAKLMQNQPLEKPAQDAVNRQRQDRVAAISAVEQGRFTLLPGGVAWALLESRLDGVLFPELLPQAKVIVQSSPDSKNPRKHRMGIRLGKAAPEGATLHQLDINSLDPNYGGRWNAGNNSRGGGSEIPPLEYACKLDELVAKKFT